MNMLSAARSSSLSTFPPLLKARAGRRRGGADEAKREARDRNAIASERGEEAVSEEEEEMFCS